MATLGVGVDIVDVPRFALALERHPRLLDRLFTEQERVDARSRPERLAARFAAKEAVLKTLHVGIGGAPWHSIEIHRDASGRAERRAARRGPRTRRAPRRRDTCTSRSPTRQLTAAAFVVGARRARP